MKILVTGSEGFIGQHVVRKLMEAGHKVTGVDMLDQQVHDNSHRWNPREYRFICAPCGRYLHDEADVVIHLAARVGVGQSMYEADRYVQQNSMDTAELLTEFAERKPKRLIVASSMSIYGEGATLSCDQGDGRWMREPLPTPETAPPDLRSIYALTKYDQEQLCLIWGRAYGVPTVALRFFNTYGPGQALSNPYTGVMAIFASRLLNGKPPLIYEDGLQSRDFIHVDDVANAVVHAAVGEVAPGAYNVGTGRATTINQVAVWMSNHLANGNVLPKVTGKQRAGDIRHCHADVTKLRATGWRPIVCAEGGIREYCKWLLTQPKPTDRVEAAHAELEAAGLCK